LKLEDLNEIPPWEWPEDAASLVIDTLVDRSASGDSRLLASELAGNLVILNEEIAEVLLGIIRSNDESPDLRSQAAISLGPGLEEADFADYSDPDDTPAFSATLLEKIQETLRDLYSNPTVEKDVRRSALEASVRNPQDWHADAIKSAFTSNDSDWRLTAVFCMRFVQGFEDQILDSLKSQDPEIHYNAIEAAGNWELDEAWPHIAKLIKSSKTEKPILIAAISAAACIRPHETDIIEPLVDSYDEDISEAAMDALTEAGIVDEWDDEEFDIEDDFGEEEEEKN
jgi:HEAT repeat protein